ncbi:SOS response-associated peptidase [Oceanobacillus sp. CAU 1775]
MCGRYTLLGDQLDFLDEFGIEEPIADYRESYNVAPGQDVLAVIHDGNNKRAGYLRWGLVPSWAKDPKIGYKMINARSETAHEKPSFKQLMSRKRCLIIADSFYEWQQTEEEKLAKRIQVKDRKFFAFAGLWDKWVQDDKTLFTCTILTRDSQGFMKDIHHRVPIILPKEAEDSWIAPEQYAPIQAKTLLDSVEDPPLEAYTVSNYVNKAQNNDENCIRSLV